MKKQGSVRLNRKLVLNRETLKNLDQETMAQVAGAYSDVSLCDPQQTSPRICAPTQHTVPLCE